MMVIWWLYDGYMMVIYGYIWLYMVIYGYNSGYNANNDGFNSGYMMVIWWEKWSSGWW